MASEGRQSHPLINVRAYAGVAGIVMLALSLIVRRPRLVPADPPDQEPRAVGVTPGPFQIKDFEF